MRKLQKDEIASNRWYRYVRTRVRTRQGASGRPEWLSCESVATKDETEAAREDACGGKDEGFGLARVKRKTTTKKTVEACSRVGMRTKLKLGRVCRLVASWQAQARRDEARQKTKTRRDEARRVGQGKVKAELESGSLSLPFCSFFARRRLRSPKSPPWLLAAFPLPLPPSLLPSLSLFPSFPLPLPRAPHHLSPIGASASSFLRRRAFLLSSHAIPTRSFSSWSSSSSRPFRAFLSFFFSLLLPPRFAEEL